MKILDESEINKEKLAAFRDAEWASVDALHYNDSNLVEIDEEDLVFVAMNDDGQIVGYIKGDTEMGTAEIESLIVGKDFRKQGVAAMLVGKFEGICKQKGIHKIWLETGIDWDARGLYEKLGYKEAAILRNHYGNKDFVLMEKFI